ncbi:integral membrane sensor signal transduction histidine kinase [Alkaliphilus metalliredigens QYMF]|uniref:histidine kinase n=1 Tax=Alkaliphilus metalliredigens (strain QYMF) TaxID=293826 RepID=A6TKQ6_ALKMQ|nr:HAMP domain-containing sensor histidine kinase [Alkaliphilus metalliredigens]ABR46774.1 integral membrane sensor signal transduction histidine kinase [Alkaliphilus metalliredigens QYMF]
MFKSIFKKFLLTYMAISIISLLMVAGVASYFMEQEIYGQREQFLEQKALQVNRLFFQLEDNKISVDYFINMLNMIQTNDKIGISVILDEHKPANIEEFGRRPVSSNRSGTNHEMQENEYFIAYFESEEERDIQMMTVSIPLIIDDALMGEVLIYNPVANVELITANVNKSIFLTFIAISIPLALLLFFISRKFTTPLIHMNEVAHNISRGDFSQSVAVQGKDEVAELGHALNHMAFKIQGLEELRKDSIANVSHELKTPLTTIQNFIEGILDGVVPKDQEENFMEIALDETKRLGRMVEELIVLSSFEKKLVKLDVSPNNIGNLVDGVFLQMKFHLQEKKIRVEKRLDTTIIAEVDQERFRQVLINLLDNAIRHMPENGKIEVCLEKSLDKNFILEIHDSGPGIKEEHLPYIFERFYKADPSRKKSGGAGLGLTISKHIVEAHGGEINIKNGRDKGLSVEITL